MSINKHEKDLYKFSKNETIWCLEKCENFVVTHLFITDCDFKQFEFDLGIC